MYNLSLIMRKHQTNTHQGTVYKIAEKYSLKYQGYKKQTDPQKSSPFLSRLRRDPTISAIWRPGLDLEMERNISGNLVKSK